MAERIKVQFRLDDLKGAQIAALLEEHLAQMRRISPPESVHALDLDALRVPTIDFWTAWAQGALVGCGAIKRLSDHDAELKSMRTTEAARGRGVGGAMLDHLLAQARARGFRRVLLETGAEPFFAPARAMYAGRGFVVRTAFADYWDDPNSVFMELRL